MIVQEEIMVPGLFQAYASSETNPNWKKQIERQQELYKREYDIRSEYERDYTRILHSLAYRRLKHKYFSTLTMIIFVLGWNMCNM